MTDKSENADCQIQAPDAHDHDAGSVGRLFHELRTGNETAVRQLLEKAGPAIIRVVRRRMNPRIRERFDSEDFTQAVWATFFGDLPAHDRFTSEQDLLSFLKRIASNKVIDAGRRVQARPTSAADDVIADGAVAHDQRLRISEPTPSEHAVANEQLASLLQGESETCRQIIRLRSEGRTQPEIAAELGISERQIRRILTRIARKADGQNADED
ncbi:MAG: sigma-70 family RNA polymerase sigma factor [Planctomycetaceae bacterium]|nr:sigma-70 family RNA polymerase sigma factor [Planctomycetaceae bacterium]